MAPMMMSVSCPGATRGAASVCQSSATSRALRSPFGGQRAGGADRRPLFNAGISSRPCSTSGSRRVTTMAAKVTGKISLALEAGKANPAPPVGPALGAQGVNIMQFCKQYNAATAEKAGQVIPVEITVYADRSFTFIMKTPPASFLLKKAAGVDKGSGNPQKEKVGQVTQAQLREIAETKLPDLNCHTIEAAMNTVQGTARNMGITVLDE
ncbi:hypothetical protein BSKO_03632 [Bryopsis sp. KO-2023]|nr:hypothetical protein BSKO_03632 [Bryopsis sp. KO-2023]